MKTKFYGTLTALLMSFLSAMLSILSGQTVKADPIGTIGYLEVECNLADVDLHACPLDQFESKTTRIFFGLFSSHQESCLAEEMYLGTTPMKPVELPAGNYVLRIPAGYAWEHRGPLKFTVSKEQKTYLLLKLFQQDGARNPTGPGDPGSSASAPSGGGPSGSGSGSGGAVGASPQ